MQLENCEFSDGGKKYKGIYSLAGAFWVIFSARGKSNLVWLNSHDLSS